MDGTIHRTRLQDKKRPFPIGDVIIWASGIAALLMLFRMGGVVTDFLYGVTGIYTYCIFILFAIFGYCLRSGKRLYIDAQYLIGSIIMIIAFFIGAMLGGAIAGLPFTLKGATAFNVVMCLLSKILLVGIFIAIFMFYQWKNQLNLCG